MSLTALAGNNPKNSDYLWVAVPDHADWLYQLGQKATVRVELYHDGMPVDATVRYLVSDDKLPVDTRGEIKLVKGLGSVVLKSPKRPGFRDLCLQYYGADSILYDHHIKVGFDVENIKPATTMPEDFDAFWDKARKELPKDLKYSMKKMEAYSEGLTDCYHVCLGTVGVHKFYGNLYIPKNAAPGSLPVIVSPPGAGVKHIEPSRQNEIAAAGFVLFQYEIHGIDHMIDAETYVDLTNAMGSGKMRYIGRDLESRDRYYMRHVYQGLIKAIDFVTSLPQWDGRNVFSYGGSQGGALSLVSAGIDPRITACVAYYPAMVEMGGYAVEGRCGGWPHFGKTPEVYTPAALETLRYYDVINFTRKVTVPTLLIFGYCDQVCPPTTSYMVWNTLECEKTLDAVPITEHWSTAESRAKALRWMKAHTR